VYPIKDLEARKDELRVLNGWRFDVLGRDLLAIKSGSASLSYSGLTNRLQLVSSR
jgi:hypothetical protein